MISNKEIELLRMNEKLRWYTFEASDAEFDTEDVDRLVSNIIRIEEKLPKDELPEKTTLDKKDEFYKRVHARKIRIFQRNAKMQEKRRMFRYNKREYGLGYALGYMFLLNDIWECSPIPIMRYIYNKFYDYGWNTMQNRQREEYYE